MALAHGGGDVYASMMFETPVTYNSIALSCAGYTDAVGGNVDFIVDHGLRAVQRVERAILSFDARRALARIP